MKIKHRIIFAFIVLLVLLLLSACGVKGQITSKSYVPAYQVMQPYLCGKATCYTYVYYPECYGIEVDYDKSTCVSREVWESLPVGSYYDSEVNGG